jgi:Ser/Thr protein kinase RdoA (MazF antagonist)
VIHLDVLALRSYNPFVKTFLESARAVARQFSQSSQIVDIHPYGHGNVHDTFLVTVDRASEPHFILQRLNTRVFCRPELLMGNLRTVTGHLARQSAPDPEGGRRWEAPRALAARDGRHYFIDAKGSFWRALSFIERARSFDLIENLGHAREVGYALGRFHRLLSDLDPTLLADTLPGFHETPGYLAHFDQVLAGQSQARRPGRQPPEVNYALRFIQEHRDFIPVLEEARAQGRLRSRPIHGDPKVNNVMLDIETCQAVALVDLDTVKPGLVHYDLGDCLRSGCNPLGEETGHWEAVRFDPDLCRAILRGYLSQAGDFLTAADYAYLYESMRLIAFELGLRFFTDYLAGNVYFKAEHQEHNLARALVQFKLTESIETQKTAIRTIIRDES